jgi:DNA-binding NtrC family response regulator/PAS domain-containing protein
MDFANVANEKNATDMEQTARQLRQSEFYLQQGERLACMGSWSLTPDLIFDYWSPETFVCLGVDPSKGIPTLAEMLLAVHPDDRDMIVAAAKKMIDEGGKLVITYRIIHPERGLRIMRNMGEALFENGKILRCVGNTADVTEQEQLIQELRHREDITLRCNAYLGQAQALSHTGCFGWNISTGHLYWSEETFRILDYKPTIEPTLELVFKRVHPDDLLFVQQKIEEARQAAQMDFEHRLLMPDESVKHVHVLARPFKTEAGNVEFIGSVMDVTGRQKAIEERKRAEESIANKTRELERSEFYLREGERLAHMGSWSLKRDRTFDYWSPETFVLFDFDSSQGIPSFAQWVALLVPSDRERLTCLVDQMFGDGVRGDIKYWIDHRKRGRRMMHSVGEPVLEDSKVIRLIGNTLDITEHERLTQELRRLTEELRKENIVLRGEIDKTSMFEEVIGASAVLQEVLARAAKVAPTDTTVLITGETGTGKELIARAIHKRSNRAERPFVSVSCAAIPSSLIMSELFGHEKGAFTGAIQRRVGRFELAEGGTLFLDEVGDLPLETQISLLRVIQEREFERIGGTEVLRCDVRVIAATNRELQAQIASGAFRSDLYYRLNVFPIRVPPLRERREDIPLLVNYFVDRCATRAGRKITHVPTKALETLQAYSWPGNVRELQNVIERSLIITESNRFSIDKSWVANKPQLSNSAGVDHDSTERQRIEAALAETKGRISGPSGAAVKLGMPASTLESKIRSHRINKHRYMGA